MTLGIGVSLHLLHYLLQVCSIGIYSYADIIASGC